MDKFAAMRAFIGVVDAGNFSRAAEQLDLPRPTVTRLVQELEKELQIQLLHRTTRRMTVTEEGRRYYLGAQQLVADADALESDVAGARSRPRGTIHVDVPGTLASSIIIPALPDFFAQYPDIAIDLKIDNRSSDLIERGIDCVIRIGSIIDDRLIARPLAELAFLTLASPAYLATRGRPEHPEELAGQHTRIQVVSPRTGQAFRTTLTRGGESVSPCTDHHLTVDDARAALAACREGLGITTTYALLAAPYLASGELEMILDDWDCGRTPVQVAYPSTRIPAQRVRVFVDWVQDLFKSRR
ncbi:MAG: LysR family transcriptional regulator [Salinicola sp.]|uniref:LysR family transcriptional regulator n=1 Tax=Salinicola sp. TaxID=1978524 RepID=UPI001D62A5F4|nr:LysR family transcriptional regulator [Salinicola sp.]NRB55988.1 LysR family transcriptional regulator [Salinicola sp.]